MSEAARPPRPGLDGPITGVEPEFLHDVPKDNLVGAIVALAAELYIVRERVQTLEAELVGRKVLPPHAVEDHAPREDEARARAADLASFVNRVLSELSRPPRPTSSIDPGVTRHLATYAELKAAGKL
ncbi:MAG: hypothetical protein O9284_18975 [Steroidobacteraceae bacterium]|nr:hypothetical protein [Steroidobacteraceae bacterium]